MRSSRSSAGKRIGTLCLTMDNMGRAREIGEGKLAKPDPNEPGLVIGYPRMLDLLDELGLRATFFVEGWNAVHHPDRVTELAQRGHEVGLHGWVHERFAALTRHDAERLIYDGTAALRRIGITPVGFRAPGGERGPHAIAPLLELGYRCDSSVGHDLHSKLEAFDFIGNTEPQVIAPGLVNIPWRWSMVDVIQYTRLPSGPRTPAELASVWLDMIDRTAQAGATMTLVIHPYMSGTDDARFAAVKLVLGTASRRDDLEIVTAGTLADRVLARATAAVI